MYSGTVRCGPTSASHFHNATTQKARDCVHAGGFYYDGCNDRCEMDYTFLVLSHHQDLEQLVYGQIFPIIVFLAVLANLAVALVLSKKHMLTPTNLVLKYMAIAELLVGLVPLPWTIFFYTMGNHSRQHKLELWWCFLQKYSMDAFPPIFHNIAMWLTVLLAGQRFISISYPLHSRAACSVRNVRIATIIIAIISVFCGIPKSLDYFTDIYEGWAFDQSDQWWYRRSCIIRPTPFLDLIGPTLFFNMYFWTRTVGFIMLPSILLVILNVLLIRGIQKAQKRKLRLLREKRSEEAARQRDSNSTSLMLVAIVSLFLVVNLPQAAFMGILCVAETFAIRLSVLEGKFPAVYLLASNMLVMATYPFNFSIYCFMSSSFRQTFKTLFCNFLVSSSYDRKRETTTNAVSRRSEYCTQLVNVCTDGDTCTEATGISSARTETVLSSRLSPLSAI